ncbi:hypothetical protein CHU98_g11990 [Xylaria longipes]|nr:hypothetical protein CHU98_g11990 [Xylaria longipes]
MQCKAIKRWWLSWTTRSTQNTALRQYDTSDSDPIPEGINHDDDDDDDDDDANVEGSFLQLERQYRH